MKNQKIKMTREQEQNSVWFIISITGTIVTIITASIIIIQFSRNYKNKSPIQYIIFLFSGILMLFLGIYINNRVVIHLSNHKDEYGSFIIIPQMLQKINIVFAIYVIYTIVKQISLNLILK
jgi:hypothetical protein